MRAARIPTTTLFLAKLTRFRWKNTSFFIYFSTFPIFDLREQRNRNRANANKETEEQTDISRKQMGSAIS